jgi:hypothetical protein
MWKGSFAFVEVLGIGSRFRMMLYDSCTVPYFHVAILVI